MERDNYIVLSEGICVYCGNKWWGWEGDDGYMDGEFICDDCKEDLKE